MSINRSWVILAALVIGSSFALAQIPREITVQGQLFQANGDPLADGQYPVHISLFEGVSSTTPVADVCAPCMVTLRSGVFSVVLGGEGRAPLPPMDRQYWLEFAIDGQPPLIPRLALTAVPYALQAAETPSQVPVGAIIAYASKKGYDYYKACDGAAVSSKVYPELYAAIDTTWGNGSSDDDPETDFNLPDLRGVFLRGDDGGAQRDQDLHARVPSSDLPSVGDFDRDGYPDVVVGTYQGLRESPTRASLRESPMRAHLREHAGSSSPPNAAVVYLIRVR